ncbi:MAG TPA: bifunctional adenosylcobinamide kinase/adenosylcobinamide-phosphate guanylyltransferase [Pyrinomonadaceae bacterium]|jgi:adenosyl cobinamide kinase/adenosyl cobinamide phosphate guanylyltransferase|nr:bifunctional adenosylcobinamide kinase/adenosylcobinamide-phosphate guanylyltransferase [Pyrinomonadaceae bacterium]
MLSLIIGQPRSGKSEYAERIVSNRAGSTVYVGTLPNFPVWRDTIRRHESRRPDSWDLLELIGNPERDTELILEALDQYQNILLDGIMVYVFQLMTVFDFDPSVLQRPVSVLVKRLASHTGNVVVVDQPSDGLRPLRAQRALCYLHRSLARRAHSLILIEDGRATPLGRHEIVSVGPPKRRCKDDRRSNIRKLLCEK